jgi:hypothetical protein
VHALTGREIQSSSLIVLRYFGVWTEISEVHKCFFNLLGVGYFFPGVFVGKGGLKNI